MKEFTSQEIKEFLLKPIFGEKGSLNRDLLSPKVSIITPSYNQGRFIEETILSVKNQDYPNIEHIIIDGGSNDNTLEIIKKYEKKYNLRWISEPDNGQAHAINKGLSLSKGEIIGWINSDDALEVNAIKKVVDFFNLHPEAHVVSGNVIVYDQVDKLIRIVKVKKINYSKLLDHCPEILQPSTFFRKKLFNIIGLLNQKYHYAMDYELWLRISMKFNWHIINDNLAWFRVSKINKSSISRIKFIKEIWEIRKSYGGSFTAPILFWFAVNIIKEPFLRVAFIKRTYRRIKVKILKESLYAGSSSPFQ